ncbi:hypothetical protein ACP275_13G044200 [Erythranthe tilingii]
MCPFEAVYGVSPPNFLSYIPGTSRVQAVDDYLKDRDAILKELHENLQIAQNRMKCQADQRRRDVQFNVGDFVFVKLQPYRQTSVAFRKSLKLSPRFFGPYEILERVRPVAYRLLLLTRSQIHDVFHVSLLRKHLGSITPISTKLPPVSDDLKLLPQPESILARRVIKKGRYQPRTEFLVKWVGAPSEDATWENARRFSKAYPDFSVLEDKDNVRGRD